MAKHARKQRTPKRRAPTSDYFTQPGKRGSVIVLRKPIGNRAAPKVCGTMPTRVHARMLIDSLEKAESVVKDLFLEATDDGIEALEAVLAACRREVLEKGPPLRVVPQEGDAEGQAEAEATGPQLVVEPDEGKEPA